MRRRLIRPLTDPSGLRAKPDDIHRKMDIKERRMRVSKWGNSLAIRLPGSVVQALGLKEGDEVEVHVAGERAFDIARDRSRERALERIRAFRKKLPADWKFDREEANAR
jgi:antitoxin MazE